MRLDSFITIDDKPNYNPRTLSIEHVLPQTVESDSEWANLWNEDERKFWTQRIANLVPLTRRKNSEAQNFDFAKKKNVYFKGKTGAFIYALTSQVLSEEVWTPTVVNARQKKLLDIFKQNWEL